MSRNFGVIPHPTRAEQAARRCTAYLPVEPDDSLGAAKGILFGLLIVSPVWFALGCIWWWA